MLNVNDKIILVKPMGAFKNVGEVCEVVCVEDGCVSFSFGNGAHLGCMSMDEFPKYFTKYVPKKTTVTKADVDTLLNDAEIQYFAAFDKCTIAVAQLKNGFVLVESSACVDPANFDQNIGREICLRNLKHKLWELEGYRLQCELSKSK